MPRLPPALAILLLLAPPASSAEAPGVAGVTVFTSGYAVAQQHAKDQPPQWHGSAGLILTARDAPALLALAGELQQSGLLMSSLAYELTPEAARSAEDALTSEALARLRQRAERVAADLGLRVLRLRDLRVGTAGGAPVTRVFAAAAAAPVAELGAQR